jgi:transaldolase
VIDTNFTRMKAETKTRVWVNNPTLEEVDLALAQGAVGCTTNPAYGSSLLKRAPDQILPIIAECTRLADEDTEAADLVQQRLVARLAGHFRPLFDASGGTEGFVSIQGAPEADTDASRILAEAQAARKLGPNVAPKLPATPPGLEAFELLVADGSPTIVTEVFSLTQLVETSERYLSVTARTRVQPPFFISPITGIFGDHLKAVAARDGLALDPHDAELIGVVMGRACQRVVEERAYPVTLLFGGARIPLDLSGFIGARAHATINWSTFAEVLAAGTPLTCGIDEPIDPAALSRLEVTFEDVRRALRPDGLTLADFELFGPVQHFRNNFIAAWRSILQAVADERIAALAAK